MVSKKAVKEAHTTNPWYFLLKSVTESWKKQHYNRNKGPLF